MTKKRSSFQDDQNQTHSPISQTCCPLCGRSLGDENINEHHLIPRCFGGKPTDKFKIHKICHRKIHSVFTERELVHYYFTWERLLENEEIQKFVKWVKNKPLGYYSGSATTNRVRHK